MYTYIIYCKRYIGHYDKYKLFSFLLKFVEYDLQKLICIKSIQRFWLTKKTSRRYTSISSVNIVFKFVIFFTKKKITTCIACKIWQLLKSYYSFLQSIPSFLNSCLIIMFKAMYYSKKKKYKTPSASKHIS